MAEYKWPEADKRTFIGKRISRIDGAHKVSGRAKYSMDINRPGMLFGKIVRSPHAHANVKSIDTSAAEAMPGVKAIHSMAQPDPTDRRAQVGWCFDSGSCCSRRAYGRRRGRAIKIEYEVFRIWNRHGSENRRRRLHACGEREQSRRSRQGLQRGRVTVEGNYGASVTPLLPRTTWLGEEWEEDKNVLAHL